MFDVRGYAWMDMGGMHGMWWIGGLLLLALVIGVLLWAMLRSPGTSEPASPMLLLQRRLARGEISPQAYEEAKALLLRDADFLR